MGLPAVSISAVALAEVGVALVMLNTAPHQPLGFWLWFGSIAAASPLFEFLLYQKLMKRRDH